MAAEDFTTFNFYSEYNRLVRNSGTELEWDGIYSNNSLNYCWKSYGSNHFVDGLAHQVDLELNFGGSGSHLGAPMAFYGLSNTANQDYRYHVNNNLPGIWGYVYFGSSDAIVLVRSDTGALDSYGFSSTSTLSRYISTGWSGSTFKLQIYSAATRQPGELLDELTLSVDASWQFENLYASAGNDGSGNASARSWGYVRDLDLLESASPIVVPPHLFSSRAA